MTKSVMTKSFMMGVTLVLFALLSAQQGDRRNLLMSDATPTSIDQLFVPTQFATISRSDDRPSCEEKYPLPDGYENWTHCEKIGGSHCGGPPQCECIPEQQLVTFRCDQGTYNQCFSYPDDGCPKPKEEPERN